ncbi:MAG: hypothetical protein RBQ97_02900 [Acholeplasma sp.]|nr:hypothetical protein [Acholeplasma sp.]
MKNKETLQAIKFTLFSISAGIIQTLAFTILNELLTVFDGEYGPNYFVALLLSILWNFTFNRKYTFKANNDIKKAMLLVLLFYIVFTPISILLGEYFKNNGINEYIVFAITLLANFVLEFLYTKFVVYPEKDNKTEDDEK